MVFPSTYPSSSRTRWYSCFTGELVRMPILIAGRGPAARGAPAGTAVNSKVKSPEAEAARRTRRPPPSWRVTVPPRPVVRFLYRSFPSLSSSTPRCPKGSRSKDPSARMIQAPGSDPPAGA